MWYAEGRQNHGKDLPLSVYEKQGFDPKRIEREVTDCMEIKGMGMCYRVDIPEVGDIFDRDEVREAIVDSRPRGSQQLALPSSSSETARAPKQVKRNKATGGQEGETAPERAAREKAEATAAKAVLKQDASTLRKVKGDAAKIIARLATVVFEGGALFKSKGLKKLPEWAVEGAKSKFAELKAVDAEAKQIMAGVGTTLSMTPSEVGDVVKEFLTHKLFLSNLLQHVPASAKSSGK